MNFPTMDTAGTLTYCETNRDGTREWVLREQVTITAAASATLSQKMPAYSTIKSVQAVNDTALVYSTAVKFGIGDGSDIDAFLLSTTTTTADARHVDGSPTVKKVGATALAPVVTASDTNGSATGTITSGTIDIEIRGEEIGPISNR